MNRKMYLVNPACDYPTYFGGDVFAATGLGKAVFVGDLAVCTVASFAPPEIDVKIVDESLSDVDFDSDADWVGITGKVTQWGRMRSIATEFRKRGKTVIIGGPFASLSPETVRPYADVLVRGEMEDIAAEFFTDLLAGKQKREYIGSKPDLNGRPVPRWDLYPNAQALLGVVQTSRGCPFECEFCDVIQYLGRKQRHKDPVHVIQELDSLYKLGYRDVFLADDNFTVYRSRTKELLIALKAWNDALPDGKVTFTTQVSVDAAMDEELIRMCAEAGLSYVFVGIETPNEDSLAESKKRQNVGVDLGARIRIFLKYGIAVMGGLIVGFDNDTPAIFEQQADFARSVPVPIFSLGALVAPQATPLHARLLNAGRLDEGGAEVGASPLDTNIIPLQMTRDHLMKGVQWLCNTIYSPAAFQDRMLMFIDALGPRLDPVSRTSAAARMQRTVHQGIRRILMELSQLGDQESQMCDRIYGALRKKPEATDIVVPMMLRYAQVRHMYDRAGFWQN